MQNGQLMIIILRSLTLPREDCFVCYKKRKHSVSRLDKEPITESLRQSCSESYLYLCIIGVTLPAPKKRENPKSIKLTGFLEVQGGQEDDNADVIMMPITAERAAEVFGTKEPIHLDYTEDIKEWRQAAKYVYIYILAMALPIHKLELPHFLPIYLHTEPMNHVVNPISNPVGNVWRPLPNWIGINM